MSFASLLAAIFALLPVAGSDSVVGDGFVIEPERLQKLLADPAVRAELRIVDLRSDAEFEKERITGSVWLDLEAWQKAAKSRGFDDAPAWYREFGALGITPEAPVVVVDAGKMTEAARVWFILKLIGHREAAVLNGGFTLAKKTLPAGAFATGPATPPSAVKYEPKAGGSMGRDRVALSAKNDVKRSIGNSAVQILDVRTAAEYNGADQKENPRGGHIPGAKNLPHARLLDDAGRLRGGAELRRIFSDAGLEPDEPIITHCQSGGRSSLAALAAARAGFENVSNYYMSFGEWSADEACPLEKPASQPASRPASRPTTGP